MTLLHIITVRDQSPQKVAASVSDANLWRVLSAVLKDLITEIKNHLPLTSLIKEEIFNLNCWVLETGVLSNQFCAHNSDCATPLKLIEIDNAGHRWITPGENNVHGNILGRSNNVQVFT